MNLIQKNISLTVNGQRHELEVPTTRTLIDCIRYDLGLTGSVEGCGVGVCGACTVLLNGKMVSSCIMLAVMADGGDIRTIEGLAADGQLDPVQQAFIDYGGFQCGICTPGQIMAARALLDQNPHPSVDQVKDWMMGNLCRCTGYYKIVESILKAAEAEAPAR
ncbi:MAG: (2Fe-2S)-binding protein [Chloroflexota bacterium]|nr:(2Fe-2S)-binding protein [Chloroflexota bacterium]